MKFQFSNHNNQQMAIDPHRLFRFDNLIVKRIYEVATIWNLPWVTMYVSAYKMQHDLSDTDH